MIINRLMSFEPYFAPADTISGQTTDIFETLSKSLDDKDKAAEKPGDKNTAKDSDDDTDDKKDELDLSFLGDDKDEDTDEDEETDKEDKSDTETDEEDEEVKELKLDEEKDEDELELSNIPKMRDIKAAYPDILKKFPALKHIFYREQAFAEVFPTVKDAKSAKESIEQFNNFQSELLNGNIENVLKTVKNTNPKAFEKIAGNFLDTLTKIDTNSHLHTTVQVTKAVLNHINKAAKQNLQRNPNDKYAEQLEIASELIHEALYNTKEVSEYKTVATKDEENPEEAKLKTERENFEKTRYSTAFSTVSSKINNILTNAVAKEIDTRNILTPYVKSNLIKDVMAECDRQLISDNRFKGLIDKLWLNARNNNYSDESLNKIQTAIKEKARTILPGIMRAKKGEALKGSSVRREKSKDNDRELSRNTTSDRTAREKTTLSRRTNEDDKPKSNESALDYLNRKLG